MSVRRKGNRSILCDSGVSLQRVPNNITIGPNPGVSRTNVITEALNDSIDSYWAIHGSGGSVSTVIIELTAYANNNLFGIYDAQNPMKIVQIIHQYQALAARPPVSLRKYRKRNIIAMALRICHQACPCKNTASGEHKGIPVPDKIQITTAPPNTAKKVIYQRHLRFKLLAKCKIKSKMPVDTANPIKM